MNKIEDVVVKEFNDTGICAVDVDMAVKKWNHLWSLSQWKDTFRLVKMLRKDSDIRDLKVEISNEQAEELIKRMSLVQIQSGVFNSGSTWRKNK